MPRTAAEPEVVADRRLYAVRCDDRPSERTAFAAEWQMPNAIWLLHIPSAAHLSPLLVREFESALIARHEAERAVQTAAPAAAADQRGPFEASPQQTGRVYHADAASRRAAFVASLFG